MNSLKKRSHSPERDDCKEVEKNSESETTECLNNDLKEQMSNVDEEKPAKCLKMMSPQSAKKENLSEADLKKKIFSLSKMVDVKIDSILNRMQSYENFCNNLKEKIDIVCDMVKQCKDTTILSNVGEERKTVVVALPNVSTNKESEETDDSNKKRNTILVKSDASSGQLGQVVKLNTEEDYPNGSWLGNPDVSEMRVRCHINPETLFHIQQECLTPDKMALVLLDHLFDKEVQALSNISGHGKHGKKKLDPLYIYGIQCHLIYKFNITDDAWHRIKLSLNSKCRTAFRRKLKGLPLHQSKKLNDTNLCISTNENTDSIEDLSYLVETAEIIHTEHGELRVVHATPDLIAKLNESSSNQSI